MSGDRTPEPGGDDASDGIPEAMPAAADDNLLDTRNIAHSPRRSGRDPDTPVVPVVFTGPMHLPPPHVAARCREPPAHPPRV